MREKNPRDVTEACTLYERYSALSSEETEARQHHLDAPSRPLAVSRAPLM